MSPMFSFLVKKYMIDMFYKKARPCEWHARVSMFEDDSYVETYFEVTEWAGRVQLECGFSKYSMAEFLAADCIVKLELMRTNMRLACHADIPTTMLVVPGGSGFLRFDVTDFDEAKTRALADFMLQWYPSEMTRLQAVRRRLAMGMALHARLGTESALGGIGRDMLALVARHVGGVNEN